MFEAHSKASNIIMAKDIDLTNINYVNSTDATLVVVSTPVNNSMVGVFIINNHHVNVRTIVRVVGYTSDDPVPGWCSNRLGVWPRPGLSLETVHSNHLIRLNFSLAASNNYKDCINVRNDLNYEVYHRYLDTGTGWGRHHHRDAEHDLFLGLKKFKDIEGIGKWGRKVASLGPHLDRLVFAAYPPAGAVFAVVAIAENGSSVYGLGHSYGCVLDTISGHCLDDVAQPLVQIFCACSLFAGLLLAFAGHKFFLASQIIFGFYAGVYLGYILLNVFFSLNFNFMFFLVMACGLCFAITIVSIWIFLGIPVLSVLLPTMELGVILASTILYLPATNTMSLTVNLHYWLVFICLVLAAPVCLLAFTHKAHILASVLVGTTLIVLPVDFYLGTGLKYVFLNVVRRSFVHEYREAILVPLFESEELILLACGLAVAALALLCQLLVQRKRPPFPPSPFQQWRWKREADRDVVDDTEPLLGSVDIGDATNEETVVRPAVVGYIQNREARSRKKIRENIRTSTPVNEVNN